MMNIFNKTALLLLVLTSLIFAGERKVLVEVFTNSHCPLCPPAHSAIDSYLQSANSSKIEYIYYHMSFPYSTDQLYQQNTSDAAAKNSFYGPYSSTPVAFFNGSAVSNSYNNWANSLNTLVLEESSFDISLSGSYSENEFKISADVTQTGDLSLSDLTINYVVVEDVNYTGNNGITNHKNVMRKIVNVEGEPFSINLNETKSLSTTITKNGEWNTNNLKVIVFVQSKSSKLVLQSESISYSAFSVTSVDGESKLGYKFNLGQNYPNPFNPTTTINFIIPSNNFVSLLIFDILGNQVEKLVGETKSAGEYTLVFNASRLANGVYYYQLRSGDFVQTKKMIVLK